MLFTLKNNNFFLRKNNPLKSLLINLSLVKSVQEAVSTFSLLVDGIGSIRGSHKKETTVIFNYRIL